MFEPIITVENLGKCYRLGGGAGTQVGRYSTLRESLTEGVRRVFKRNGADDIVSGEDFWALKDVSFSVAPGEVVGIIGRNGAGKSTLLKVLSRITEPTQGRVTLRGRVASLLEVGTGFHPELTGRENIFLNGAVLGMGRHEIRAKFDEIVAFAEVERFLDTPVKRYSSGMYVRLAFAVAAHLEPEILIVDEVLAVGDAEFQEKCLGKMQEVAQGQGRTVLFVSHNMAAVRRLCSRAVLLRGGRLLMDESSGLVVDQYLHSDEASDAKIEWMADDPRANDENIGFRRAWIEDAITSQPCAAFDVSQSFAFVVEYEVRRPLRGLRVGFLLQRSDGILMCGSNDPSGWSGPNTREPGLYRSRCVFPGDVLNSGTYVACFGYDTSHQSASLLTAYSLRFPVEDTQGHDVGAEPLPGLIRPRLSWEILTVSSLARPVAG